MEATSLVTCRQCGRSHHSPVCCPTCQKATPHYAVTKGALTPSQRVCWDPSQFVGFSPEQIALIHRGFMHGLDRAFDVEREAAKERAEDAEFFGDPEDTVRLENGVNNCNDWGTGGGQFHGRIG